MSEKKQAPRASGPGRAKRIAIVALSLGIATTSLPLVLAAPASATGCTVTPLAPVYMPATLLQPAKVNYPVRVVCDVGRPVDIRQQRYEQDPHPNPDDYLGGTQWTEIMETMTINNVQVAPNTEQSSEEVYHQVRFRVAPLFGPTGSWSKWQTSPVTGKIG